VTHPLTVWCLSPKPCGDGAGHRISVPDRLFIHHAPEDPLGDPAAHDLSERMHRYQELRKELEAELHEVLATNERLTNHLRNVDRTLPADSEDLAQFLENDEVLEALEARSRDRLEELRTAIARIDAGDYDRCAACGSGIEEGRLEVLPTTTLCVACAGGGN